MDTVQHPSGTLFGLSTAVSGHGHPLVEEGGNEGVDAPAGAATGLQGLRGSLGGLAGTDGGRDPTRGLGRSRDSHGSRREGGNEVSLPITYNNPSIE